MIMTMDSATTLWGGIPLTVVGVAQASYFVWVSPRLSYTIRVVSVATNVLPDPTTTLIVLALVTATLYSSVLGLAITGSAAVVSRWDALAISGFILSLLWTLHTIKNTLRTIIAHVKYKIFAIDQSIPTLWAIGDTLKYLVVTIALGSALVPVITVLVVSVWLMRPVLRKLVKFLSSFSDPCYHVSTMLSKNGNRYGFVYAGAYNRGFVQPSRAAWQLLEGSEINELVELDVTGSFCLFSGLTGGTASSLVVRCWMQVTRQDHFPEISAFAQLIGYQMVMWAKASVSAYYIAYAKNSQSAQFETTVRARLEAMRKSQVTLFELELRNRQM
ncbi:hypothetical protein MLD38_038845 [Melastoma candidum]|uniref:Uncharacterized protein n=1 Tax=Melastoma candidum TaxID=119954 RepID=A0ACB9L0W4_9MYRT|nr:hypothetical protein MLD38_038845 [Melastoma candidum]